MFHLTGHADLVEGGGRFLTENETGEAHAATAEEIARALVRMPRLVFLSGCQTGEAGAAGAVPSLAEELLDLGAGAVLGWGRPVLDRDASGAAAHLYKELARGWDAARAIAMARQALIRNEARDWHLLRLYVAGDPPGALVTPLRTQSRGPAPRPSAATRFLDENLEIKVPTRQGFVGRRRILQRCLRALRDDRDKVGVLIHGMGGLGKSSLAARLCDRLGAESNVVIRVGRIDEHGLANRLGEDLDKPLRDLLMNPDDELKFKLRDLFGRLKTPLLLVLDDFEVNFERREDGLELRDGLPVITTAANLFASLLFVV